MLNRVKMFKELILIGGGHTHAIFLRKWGMKPIQGVQLSLISPSPVSTYTGMLPGFLAGHYSKEQIEIDLVKLCRFAGARFIIGSVDNIVSKQKLISITGRGSLLYDVASLDIGVTSLIAGKNFSNLNTNSIRPLGSFVDRWISFTNQVKKNKKIARIVIIGGGVGAVEIAMAMAHSLRKLDASDYKIAIIYRSELLKNVRPGTRKTILSVLKKNYIETFNHAKVANCTKNSVVFHDGYKVESNFTVIAAGATAHEWLGQSDLPLYNGFIEVDEKLQVLSGSNIFAVGDCAHLSFSPRPKAGVFAVRQAPILYKNVRSMLLNQSLNVFSPQKNYLKLISLGEKKAVADYVLPSFSGRWVWNLKNKIDKAFMSNFFTLPQMSNFMIEKKIPNAIADVPKLDQMLCGGCGAKVGSDLLDQVLKNINTFDRKSISTGIGDDAAVITVRNKNQILTTDHLREFNSDLWFYAASTAVHSLGDIWAMGGEPNVVTAHIIIPEGAKRIQENWLNQIIKAASNIFSKEGAIIVGGHTSVGAEFSIGFSILGNIAKKPILISGAKPGDSLVLTKPIGSGTILAGEMQFLANGLWVQSAMEWMIKPQSKAVKILSKATAMTDVTGFGLAGHLLRLCQSSNVSASLEMSNVQFLKGAEELAETGIRSSLYEDNLSAQSKMSFVPSPKASLLFDPQTSGGLLATIPKKEVDTVVRDLKKTGFCSNVIGSIKEGKPFIYVN